MSVALIRGDGSLVDPLGGGSMHPARAPYNRSPMNPDRMHAEALSPGLRVTGQVAVPGSKSIAQRALLLGALAPGKALLQGDFSGADVDNLLRTLSSLGLQPAAREPATLSWGHSRPVAAGGPVQVGESGTSARLWTAQIALGVLGSGSRSIQAGGTLLRRRSPALLKCLREAGAVLTPESPGQGDFPLTINPAPNGDRALRLDAPSSSQEVSALLLALAARRGGPSPSAVLVSGAIPSRPYVDLTCAVLAAFGVRVSETPWNSAIRFDLAGKLEAPSEPYRVEADASAAAVALAAGCLSGGEVSVPGLGPESIQGDRAIVDHLRQFGCRCDWTADGPRASGRPQQGARLDLGGEPDLAPVLAAVAAAASHWGKGPSQLRGLGTLPGKESDRIAVLERGLRQLGFEVESSATAMSISGTGHQLADPSHSLDPHGDHRMAFAFALLGLVLPGVRVREAQCVSKSWPAFWSTLRGQAPTDPGSRQA